MDIKIREYQVWTDPNGFEDRCANHYTNPLYIYLHYYGSFQKHSVHDITKMIQITSIFFLLFPYFSKNISLQNIIF